MNREEIQELVWIGVFGGLEIALPVIFHAVGLGSTFLPMFLPLAVAACVLRLGSVLFLAVAVPPFSAILTGMPPVVPPIAFLMVAEGLGMGTVIWLTVQKFRWPAPAGAAAGLAAFVGIRVFMVGLFGPALGFPGTLTALSMTVHAIPGMVLIFLVAPSAAALFMKRLNF